MYTNTIDFSEYGEGPPYHSNENDTERPAEEFWPELYNNHFDGDESSSEEIHETVWNQKRRKSSVASKTSARDERAINTRQGGSHRKSLSEPVKRERNRTAAAKCRAKSKVAEEDLKETQRIERERNFQLRATVEELNNESLMLKQELLSHSNCDHPIINNYLNRAADQISRGYSGSSRTRERSKAL